jgi:hypothetical protein
MNIQIDIKDRYETRTENVIIMTCPFIRKLTACEILGLIFQLFVLLFAVNIYTITKNR